MGPLAVATALLLMPVAAMAASCSLENHRNFSLDGARETVIKQNAAIGTEIRRLQVAGDGAELATCEGVTVVDSHFVGLAPSEIPGIYQTGIAGLGLKVEWEPTGGARGTFPFQAEIDQPGRYDIHNDGTLHLAFYRIAGDFTGGMMAPGAWQSVAETLVDTLRVKTIRFRDVPFRLATCSITTASLNQTVNMRAHAPHDFDADGSGPWRDFSLESETCDLAHFSEAYFTFSGDTPEGRPDLFAIEAEPGAAQGVGLGLQSADGTPIVPGAVLSRPVVGTGSRYEFQARYKRLADPLTSGPANARVMVNVEYN